MVESSRFHIRVLLSSLLLLPCLTDYASDDNFVQRRTNTAVSLMSFVPSNLDVGAVPDAQAAYSPSLSWAEGQF